jgi:hypothetical protein
MNTSNQGEIHMASIQLKYTVEMEDGNTFEVTADQRDLSKYERSDAYVNPIIQYDAQGKARQVNVGAQTQTRYLAFNALRRTKQINLSWQKFDDTCVEVMYHGDEEDVETDPTQTGQ